jgi:diguanylate cyclase (GGDEF)-like protein/PAS domain S-box-containing protein
MKSSIESRRQFKEDERNGCAPSPKMIRAVLNLASDIVLFFPADALRFVDVNEAACTALGYSKRKLLTMELPEVVAPAARDALASAIRQSDLEPAAPVADLTTLRRRDGTEFPIEATIRQFRGLRRSLTVLVGRDATERKCLEHLWAFPAHLDPLTGLPNRAVLESRLQAAASRSAQCGGRLALFLIDLDRFKQINDERGHLAGDAVLKIIAERLGKCLRGGDVVVRYGGDEFVVLADGLVDAQEAAGLADRIVAAVKKPITLGADKFHISASIGIAIAQRNENSPERLLSGLLPGLLARADRGMYQAKAAGREGHYVIHEERGL